MKLKIISALTSLIMAVMILTPTYAQVTTITSPTPVEPPVISVYGTANETIPVVFGDYKVYAILGKTDGWVNIVIKEKNGLITDALVIKEGETAYSSSANLDITVNDVRALDNGTVIGANLIVGAHLLPFPIKSRIYEGETRQYKFQVSVQLLDLKNDGDAIFGYSYSLCSKPKENGTIGGSGFCAESIMRKVEGTVHKGMWIFKDSNENGLLFKAMLDDDRGLVKIKGYGWIVMGKLEIKPLPTEPPQSSEPAACESCGMTFPYQESVPTSVGGAGPTQPVSQKPIAIKIKNGPLMEHFI